MRMKKRGLEPSYAGALARAPAALRNPTTGEPFNKKTVYDRVFKTHCHEHHWLTDERNVIVLWLNGRQTWCERPPLSPPRPLPLGQRRRVG